MYYTRTSTKEKEMEKGVGPTLLLLGLATINIYSIIRNNSELMSTRSFGIISVLKSFSSPTILDKRSAIHSSRIIQTLTLHFNQIDLPFFKQKGVQHKFGYIGYLIQ